MNTKEKPLHFEILNQKQKKLLPELSFLKKHGFYLAGGTALALQIGHRSSVDFDFYSLKKFGSEKILSQFRKRFKDLKVIHQSKDTLLLLVSGLDITFFYYDYPLIKPLVELKEVNLASLEDIAAMKIVAIIQRKTKRDYIDLYCLLNKLSLEKILDLTKEKYGQLFNWYLALRALIYFDDIEPEKNSSRMKLLSRFDWPNIQKDLIKMVGDFKKNNLSKNE